MTIALRRPMRWEIAPKSEPPRIAPQFATIAKRRFQFQKRSQLFNGVHRSPAIATNGFKRESRSLFGVTLAVKDWATILPSFTKNVSVATS